MYVYKVYVYIYICECIGMYLNDCLHMFIIPDASRSWSSREREGLQQQRAHPPGGEGRKQGHHPPPQNARRQRLQSRF